MTVFSKYVQFFAGVVDKLHRYFSQRIPSCAVRVDATCCRHDLFRNERCLKQCGPKREAGIAQSQYSTCLRPRTRPRLGVS